MSLTSACLARNNAHTDWTRLVHPAGLLMSSGSSWSGVASPLDCKWNDMGAVVLIVPTAVGRLMQTDTCCGDSNLHQYLSAML